MKVSANCFTSPELRAWSEDHLIKGFCDFSGSADYVFNLEDVFPFFKELFGYFEPSPTGNNLFKTIQNDWSLFSDDSFIIPILQETAKSLGFNNLLIGSVTYSQDIIEPKKKWNQIRDELRSNRRFFAERLLGEDDQWDKFFGVSNNTIDNGTRFYRGRINTKEDEIFTHEDDLRMPPPNIAPAGRANVAGIPYLYLTTDEETVMYECRASAGDHISIGIFENPKEIKIVDFTFTPDLFEAYNIITFDLKTTLQQYLFFSAISKDLSHPIRRYDNKELDYLSTQFVCEYIRLAGQQGVLFKSSQHPTGKNLVLFNNKDVEFKGVNQRVVGDIIMNYEK